MATKIEWTDETWNPVTGCTKVSEGCENCYAEKMTRRLIAMGHEKYYPVMDSRIDRPYGWNGEISCDEESLDKPRHWKRPRRIFVCSMSDLFHPKVPFAFIEKVFRIIYTSSQHTFQILTKRPEAALEFTQYMRQRVSELRGVKLDAWYWPENIWLGVSVENQKRADERIPILLQLPAAVRGVSIEPMLSGINLAGYLGPMYKYHKKSNSTEIWRQQQNVWYSSLDWVIIGGESGPKRRPCKLEWVRDLVGQCKAAGVPVFVKQLSINGKVSHNPAEWPKELRVQEYPVTQKGGGDD